MAEPRFYFWESYERGLATLPTDEDRGEMVMAMCAWAFRDEDTDFDDRPQMKTAWEFIKGQLTQSVEIGKRNSERGKLGGRPPKNSSKSGAKAVLKRRESDMNGHERTGHEPGPFQGPDAGFASAPSGAGSPASDDDFRESFMLSQSLVGKLVGGGA